MTDNRLRRSKRSRVDRDTGPTVCAVPDCPSIGTISESTTHEDPRDVRWYCRDHWALRGEPEKAHQLAIELSRAPLKRDRRHWADVEVSKRMLELPDEADKTARQFLDDLLKTLSRRAA